MLEHRAGPFAASEVEVVEHDAGVEAAGKIEPRLPRNCLQLAYAGSDLRAGQIKLPPLGHELAVHDRALKLRPAALSRIDDQQGVTEDGVAVVQVGRARDGAREVGAGQRGVGEVRRSVELRADELGIGQCREAEVGRESGIAAVRDGGVAEIRAGEVGFDEDHGGERRAVEVGVGQILTGEVAHGEREAMIIVAALHETRRA